jgi:serine phosphatase RsbU (regulator of sigma subunit)
MPLGAAPGTSGWLWLGFPDPREFDAEEQAFLLACAGQTALALERARLYEQARDVAHSLQRSLLAGAPLDDPRFEVATLYHAAVEHLEVGGDWHDAFALHGGGVGVVVGDVVGRGLAAASAMGQLRSAVRALAGAGFAPGAVLEHLDTFVEQNAAARYATLAYAEVDPDAGEVTIASAGHLPAVLLEPDEPPRLIMEGRSTPLGVTAPGFTRAQARFRLARGAGFLLYTDGLVERRGEAIDAGIERLLEVIRATPDRAPGALARTLPHALLRDGPGSDDVCLLAFCRRSAER